MRNDYTVSFAFSVAAVTSTGFYSVADYTTIACSSEFAMSTQYTNPKCLAQGAAFIWGLVACVMWMALRTLVLHLQIVWSYGFNRRTERIVAHCVGWGIPTLITTIGLGIGGIRFELGHSCGPSIQKGSSFLWIPLMVICIIPVPLHLWTLGKVASVMKIANVAPAGAPPTPAATTTTAATGAPYSPSVDTTAEEKAAARQPQQPNTTNAPKLIYRQARLGDVIRLQWRTIALCFGSLFIVCFYSINQFVTYALLENTVQSIARILSFVQCFISSGYTQDSCYGLGMQTLPIWRILSAEAFKSTLGIFLLILEGRRSFWKGWGFVFVSAYRAVSKRRRPSAQSEDATVPDSYRISTPRHAPKLRSYDNNDLAEATITDDDTQRHSAASEIKSLGDSEEEDDYFAEDEDEYLRHHIFTPRGRSRRSARHTTAAAVLGGGGDRRASGSSSAAASGSGSRGMSSDMGGGGGGDMIIEGMRIKTRVDESGKTVYDIEVDEGALSFW